MQWSVEMRYREGYFPYLSAAGRDSVFVCGWVDFSERSVTHYNLVTGEELCTVKLDGMFWGMTTILYDNWWCIAVAYW